MTADAGEAVGCRPWAVPEFDGTGPVTVADLESVHEDAYAQGFEAGRRDGDERGFAEGRARVQAELAPRVAEFAALIAALAEPLECVDEEVEESLVGLATAVARQLVRRELSLHPGQVIEVVREALRALPIGSRIARITLNPDDAALVREALAAEAEEGSLRLVEDLSMSRGGCLVQTDVSSIDARVESRLASVISQVLGGERVEPDPAGVDGVDDGHALS